MLDERGIVRANFCAQDSSTGHYAITVSAQKVEHPKVREALGRASSILMVDCAELVVLVEIDCLRVDNSCVREQGRSSKKLLGFEIDC